MLLRELCEKDVVSIRTGVNLGRPDDFGFDPGRAVVQQLVLMGRPKWFGLMGREPDVTVGWGQIVTIGADVILVDVDASPQDGRHHDLFHLRGRGETEEKL